jgi:hypothetical protein
MSNLDSNKNVSLEEDVRISIATHDMNVQFKGSVQSILQSTLDFFAKQFPEVDLARKISLNYDTHYLTEKYSQLINITPEGVQGLVRPDATLTSIDITEEAPLNGSGAKDAKVVADQGPAESKLKHDAKWSIKEFIALQLVASRIAKGLGIIQDEGMKTSDIESATKANPKSVTSRLSEMMKSGYVTKDLRFSAQNVAEGKEDLSTIYRITTAGIHWLNNIIDKK